MNDLKLKWDLYARGLKNSGWDSLLQRGIETAGHIGNAIAKPTPVTIAQAAMSIARTLTTSDMYYGEVLDPRLWKPLFPSCIKAQLLEVLEPRVDSKIRVSSSGDTIAYLITKGEVRIGWVKDGEDGVSTEILAHVDHYEESANFARDLLWKTVDASRLLLSSSMPDNSGNKQPRRGRGDYGQLRVTTDDLVTAAPSKFALEYADYLKKHASFGHNRTVLLYGPPGTGKSTIARTLCETMSLRSLRVRVEDVGSLGSEPVVEMMRIFDPDVVIFDDLDRAISQVALLETLENLHKRVRFVFATVNHIENLQQALIRPGRFDELIEITKLDEAAVRKVLGSDCMDSFEVVKDWPVAFINEYVLRRKVLGKEKALSALDELRGRVDRLMGTTEEGPSEPEPEEEDGVW